MSDQQQHSKAIVEALSPEEIALQVEQVGVAKARAGAASTLALAVMGRRLHQSGRGVGWHHSRGF